MDGPGAAMQVEVTLPVMRLIVEEDEQGEETRTTNAPPVVAIPLVDQSAMVDAPFAYVMAQGTFTDADGDPLTYSASLSDGTAPWWPAAALY